MRLIRSLIERLEPYVPGEQPKDPGLVKLNTNENPYPPSPRVIDAVKDAVDARLRLYPNPTAAVLRDKLARYHGCRPENIIVGNGSDELLALAVRCFVEPVPERCLPEDRRGEYTVQFPSPCYSLYSILARIHGALVNEVPLDEDFGLPGVEKLLAGGRWNTNAALTFITTPNAPSGRAYSKADLENICAAQAGVVWLDEAYVDFGAETGLDLALSYPNVIVSRTFSKAFSLCFQRIGYCIGPEKLIGALQKIRDSYSVNGLGQVAAEATLEDLEYYYGCFERINETRESVSEQLTAMGFDVLPSKANFILVRPPCPPAGEWLGLLRRKKILVRWFDKPRVRDYLRVSIGSCEEMEQFMNAVREIISET
ncbi:MAG: histidinol-phosphate transaminase [Verrucomicrobia bacterium]|nr:histidinol-phosphate transaminase [Verrucomicrobiota bacterium]MCF7707357.1 histidinol-phosphate transaminase [Verrucomicrobiota bacterium]